MEIIQVNQETCNRCGLCIPACGKGLIDFHNDYPMLNAGEESECIRCGHCVAVCPTASLTHRDIPVEECSPIQKSLQITAEQCEHLIMSRRSIRAYDSKPVPRDVIAHLIEIARYAPTGRNDQNVGWLVIDSKEQLRHLQRIGIDWLRLSISNQRGTPFATVMERQLEREENGANELLRDAPVLIMTHAEKNKPMSVLSCAAALSYLDLAATCAGLGCCWSGHMYNMANSYPPVQEMLSIPEGHKIYGCLMMGYPKLSYYRIPLRQPPRVIWH